MSMLTDLKFMIKKYIKNPVLIAAISYTIYVLINKYVKKEAFAESIKVIKSKGVKAVIYDDKVKKYILIDHEKGIYSDDNPDRLLKMLWGN